jgi:hypothetical protein
MTHTTHRQWWGMTHAASGMSSQTTDLPQRIPTATAMAVRALAKAAGARPPC